MANHDRIESRLRQLARSSGYVAYLDMLEVARGISRVTGDDTTCLTSDGGTISTTVYQIDMSAGVVLIGGTVGAISALDDQDLLADLTVYELDGSTSPTAISNGEGVVALGVVVLINDVPTLLWIWGATGTGGAEVVPTATQVFEALRDGAPTNYYSSGLGVIVSKVTIRRQGQATFTFSGTPDVGAPADNMQIIYDSIDTNRDVTSTTLNTEVAALKSDLTTALAAKAVTVGGTGAVITITADVGTALAAYSSAITLGGVGDLDVTESVTDTVTMVHADPASDTALKAWREAGALHS
jgi:hypothetical protein